MSGQSDVSFRAEPVPADRARVRAIVASTGKFTAEEIDIAVELVDDRLAKGTRSDYSFLFAERQAEVVGYACFGRIAGSDHSYDVYWIAVDQARQGQGFGKAIMRACEDAVRTSGGARLYIDTSARPDYASTRAFYEACGYRCDAVLRDFYRNGDGKAIYVRVL
jgi:ribosomal protein S18 acetylase RimI-like enzyme